MTREGLTGFSVAVAAFQRYRDLMRTNESASWHPELAAKDAFADVAAFLRVAKRHDLATGEPNGLPADVELEVAGDSR